MLLMDTWLTESLPASNGNDCVNTGNRPDSVRSTEFVNDINAKPVEPSLPASRSGFHEMVQLRSVRDSWAFADIAKLLMRRIEQRTAVKCFFVYIGGFQGL